MMNLAHPGLLWLLPVLMIPLIAWYIYSQDKNEPEMNVSSTRAFDNMGTSWKVWLKHLSFALKMGALACLVIILCRPQTKDSWSTSDVEGTDIVIALDVSTSEIQKQSGIIPFVLTGDERYLDLRAFPEDIKLAAWERQNHICPLCGREFDYEFMEGDHITPWREGGRTVIENCQMLCRECNRRKGAK